MNKTIKGETPSVDFKIVLQTEASELERRREMRPPPVPLDSPRDPDPRPTGLALSGGGIRSAATCIGAIQALRVAGRFDSFDYLSTVSGGGYAGACLSAAMSTRGGGQYPYGDDVRDSDVVAHIRNYSNYLLPRNRSAVRNFGEAAVILLRGLLANALCVVATILLAVAITYIGFSLPSPLLYLPAPLAFVTPWSLAWTTVVGAVLGMVLLAWAMLRSVPALDRTTSDTASNLLSASLGLLCLLGGVLFLELQPIAIEWLRSQGPHLLASKGLSWDSLTGIPGALLAFAGAISAAASALGKFLQTSKRSQKWQTIGLRWLTRGTVFLAALVVPLLIWASYLILCAWLIPSPPPADEMLATPDFRRLLMAVAVSLLLMGRMRSNGYSLHQLYRDRLSKAFLVSPDRKRDTSGLANRKLARSARAMGDLPPLDGTKLSALGQSDGPYPLINAALNVQGSLAANKRGRDADFFLFSPYFVGSELTRYAETEQMERRDSRLDLACAMAISGAAASANMGGKTIRVLSPTLALLNVRLGYYLTNPYYVGEEDTWANRLRRYLGEQADRFYLIIEMFNRLHERRRNVYLTDGGHIENLGVYALLKRRCRLIFVIDAEADPELGFESLLRVERYARIDLGARITLPWEAIAAMSRTVSTGLPDHCAPCMKGPHVAIGTISYVGGGEGLLVYVKSSLSGDEKDYVLDYAERNLDFPHETTGDQFFSEEQFEMYRALGFHMVSGLFGEDRLAIVTGSEGFRDDAEARAKVDAALPRRPVRRTAPPEQGSPTQAVELAAPSGEERPPRRRRRT
uniref:patatin-like phospholipase family protein n=1 Tax=Altererythrobacter segetis TaxID=1104773 RepID=UPI001A9C4530|nr:patatin-like phospholipase family protein [Altererythrobacter segetis]